MAALLGVNMPQNSMGKLPIDYLKLHEVIILKNIRMVLKGYFLIFLERKGASKAIQCHANISAIYGF